MKPPLTTEARPTPKTDEYAMSDMIMSDARFRYITRWIHFAQELERSNQVLTEALERAKNAAVRAMDFVPVAGDAFVELAVIETICREALQRPTP